jgi:hypothetical protein
MNDNRIAPRQRTLKGARIVTNDGFSTFDVLVRNLSETGARLKVSSIVGIPDAFELRFDDGRHFKCRAVWRRTDEIGVSFSD